MCLPPTAVRVLPPCWFGRVVGPAAQEGQRQGGPSKPAGAYLSFATGVGLRTELSGTCAGSLSQDNHCGSQGFIQGGRPWSVFVEERDGLRAGF